MKLKKEDWEIKPISQREAVALIKEHHYSKSSPNTAVFRHGLFRKDGKLSGVALWLPPTITAARSICPAYPNGVLALSRLVVLPFVPKNGASFLLGRSMKLVDRKRWPTLVTYADTGQGHTGAIYLATNWAFDKETPAGDTWINKNGQIMGRKRGGKNLSSAEMKSLGFSKRKNLPKLRFVHKKEGPEGPP